MTKIDELRSKLKEVAEQTPAVFGVTLQFRGSYGDGFIEIVARLDHFKINRVISALEVETTEVSVNTIAERIVKDILHSLQYAKLEKDLALMMES